MNECKCTVDKSVGKVKEVVKDDQMHDDDLLFIENYFPKQKKRTIQCTIFTEPESRSAEEERLRKWDRPSLFYTRDGFTWKCAH